MGKKDKKMDAYIAKSADFAKPILVHLRELVHKVCPEVEESIKWSMPAFDYKGPLFMMAAFKQHAVGGFWKAPLLKDPNNYLKERKIEGGSAMGHLGKITSLKDLPPDKVLTDFIRQSMKLNEAGIKPVKVKRVKKALKAPDFFLQALKKDKDVWKVWEAFSPSKKDDYIEWMIDAKTDATREKRLATAIEWIGEGKPRNWKYMKKATR